MITLTNKGWKGSSSGKWNKKDNIAKDKNKGVLLDSKTRARSVAGDDEIIGFQKKRKIGVDIVDELLMGADKDLLKGKSINNSGGIGISNEGLIDMGISNDEIIGIGRRDGIFNDGTIDMDDGNDLVDASRGGFAGNGRIFLGKGRDTIKGYGEQKVDGGAGRDKLLLDEGFYNISIDPNPFDDTLFLAKGGQSPMQLDNIEEVGSILSGDTVDLTIGTLKIGQNGVAQYI